MATKRLKRPRDPIALGKLIGDIATGQVCDATEDNKNATAALGSTSKGGAARAIKLSKKRRTETAKKAAAKRWRKA
jgi:hypothetical protein